MAAKKVLLIVSGKVQGVFYRDYVRIEAENIGIQGYVRNMPDKTVEIVAAGTEAQLKKFILACRKGSFLARVEDVREESYYGSEEFDEFEIRF